MASVALEKERSEYTPTLPSDALCHVMVQLKELHHTLTFNPGLPYLQNCEK